MATRAAGPRLNPLPASVFRGFYERVADRLGVDPFVVRRVALGELQSEEIIQALEREMREVMDNLKSNPGRSHRPGVRRNPANHAAADSRES